MDNGVGIHLVVVPHRFEGYAKQLPSSQQSTSSVESD